MQRKATRRTFLKLSAAAASVSAATLAHALPAGARIAIVTDDDSPLTNNEAVRWATGKLREAIGPQNIAEKPSAGVFSIVIAPVESELAKAFPKQAEFTQAETTALIPGARGGSLLATGSDVRGVTYAVLELADRIRLSDAPMQELRLASALVETTPNKVRSISRGFCSEVEDKPWYYDRSFWTTYLDGLASARFNRFAITFGLGYDFPRGVTGDYFHFPYPYLVEVPGYEGVHVEPALEPGERQRNLEALKFIAAETARRGMEFQLGIWTHAYEWTDSPHSDHHIVGLTPETHAAYCRDALGLLLKACPQITGVTMRIHGESGIPEGSYPFWQTVFDAIPAARTAEGKPRVIEIDMHAKGLNQTMIDMALKTGMPVKAGAKYWAEHLGLGYQQADIRAAEYPREGVTGTFAVSNGARNFTRYGYGDFYQQGSGIELLYRVWPGTQRHLLWGDPALAAGYGRAANFCGAAGLELMEPLFFKGREGSGNPGGRDAYADATLGPAQLDTAKFAVTYLLWGRYLYNPDTAPEVHHRYLRQAFGPAGPALETALANSSRILPLITTAWLPSASNHDFWPEMLTPVSILPYTTRPPYTDNPAPHNASVISPLDPQLFTTIEQHAKDLVAGTKNAKYNTSEVIAWLEGMVATSTKGLEAARAAAGMKGRTAEFRRAEEDVLILNGLGAYYANSFRAALLYSIYEQTGDTAAATQSLAAYKKAQEAWAAMASRAKTVYSADVSYGAPQYRRGDWAKRLPLIDADVAAVEKHYSEGKGQGASASAAIRQVAASAQRSGVAVKHIAPQAFHAGGELALRVGTPADVTEAVLWYRHVNQGERWLSTPMQRAAGEYAAAIPAAYTDSPYPLQYYFELHTASAATLYPALNATLSNQPYYAVYKRA